MYGEDLAYIHDHGYSSGAGAAARYLIGLLRRQGIRRGVVLDLGCGSGHSTEVLAGAGYRVLGVDASPAMIRLAKHRAPHGRFRVGALSADMLSSCDAILAAGEVFNYVTSRMLFQRLLRRAFEVLSPGGMLVFDLRMAPDARSSRTWVNCRSEKGWAVLAATQLDRSRTQLVRTITSYRFARGRWRRQDEVHVQRLYVGADVRRWLRAAGFRVQIRRGYGAHQVAPSGRVFLAEKPRMATSGAVRRRLRNKHL